MPDRADTRGEKALLHHVTIRLLRESFEALKNAAPGVDGVTWREYETGLADRLNDLHDAGQTKDVPVYLARRNCGERTGSSRLPHVPLYLLTGFEPVDHLNKIH